MLSVPENLQGYPRPDLIDWVASECVPLKTQSPEFLEQVSAWCEARWGEARAGNILQEAQEGWIDYFDGEWQMICDPFYAHERFVIWIADRNNRAEYALVWS